MHRVVENMGATELRKKYDRLPLFFWRLAGGAELLLEEDILRNEEETFKSGPPKIDRKPLNDWNN